MRSFISKKCRGMGLLWLAAVMVFIFAGCATPGPAATVSGDAGKDLTGPAGAAEAGYAAVTEEKTGPTVESVNVVGKGDSVLIQTDSAVLYTAFRLTDPPRLVIDMPEADLSNLKGPIHVDNRYIRNIRGSVYGGTERISRIILELKDGIDHEIKSGVNSILITLREDPFAGVAGVTGEGSPVVMAAAGELSVVENPPAGEEAQAVEEAAATDAGKESAEPLTPAASIKDIAVLKSDGNTVIQIVADGEIGDYNTFEIGNPSRIVVDVWGVSNSTGTNLVRVNDSFIKAVRIGNHPDKIRFVFDAAGDEIPPYVITKTGNSIVASFNPLAGAEKEGAAPVQAGSASTGMAQAVPEPAVETVKEVVAQTEETAPPIVTVVEEPAPPIVAVAEEPVPEEDVRPDAAVVEPVVEGDDGVAVNAEVMDVKTEEATPEVITEDAPVEKTTEVIDVVEGPEMAVEETPAPVAETPVEQESVQASNDVKSIEFKKIGDKGYLTIETSEKPVYTINESSDGKTLVLDFKDTAIGEDLTRTLDATKLETPVATISSYQRSVRPGAVRIFVELAEKADHELREFNNTLTVVFNSEAAVAEQKAAKEKAAKEKQFKAMASKKYTGRKIDLDMMDARVTDILRLIAEVSDLNIIASDDVTGSISLRLKNVPWDQAFDLILKSKGLDKIREGNVIRVAPAANIIQERETNLAARRANEKIEPLDIKFLPVNYAKADELIEQVKSVLSSRGSVMSEMRTNTLIIRDINKGIDAAVELVSKLDTPIRQVLIEARIVEAETTFSRDLGIQWGVDFQTDGNVATDTFGSTVNTGQTPPETTTSPIFETREGVSNYAVNLPASGTTLGALGFILGKAGQNPLVLDLRLSAGEQEGRLRTISRPRVVSMDNKEARIEQGESIPYETTSASGTATTFVDASLSLVVTPHITPDGSVLMKIVATKNSIGSTKSAITGAPSIATKEASTEVLVKDGETTVIGGIVISDKSNNDNGIPYLRKIPIFGWLFKSKSISDSQKELLIFITPTIIKDKVIS
ncbi:MAG: hypothetical protein BMS9Abin23_0066 [Thermodesulfobacteriota bacterium]|nr:MAG: hypothetical protein BMS9Abin23_0066 [Thermodesulfobacteriota bacterium]